MNWKVIKTEPEYQTAIKRTLQIFDADPNTPKGEELQLLLVLVKEYEDKYIHLPEINTVDAIKLKMDERGITPKDL